MYFFRCPPDFSGPAKEVTCVAGICAGARCHGRKVTAGLLRLVLRSVGGANYGFTELRTSSRNGGLCRGVKFICTRNFVDGRVL